jgi:DNA polymerase-3 subunit delta
MKLTSLTAFEKHLKEAAQAHLSRVYMVVAAVHFERKKIIEKIKEAVQPDTLTHFDATSAPMEKVVAQLNTLSLLGERPLIILEGFEKLKKGDLEILATYLQKPSPFAYLVLSGASLKGQADLYQKAKKEVIVLDLSEEKPWEKEKRLREYLTQSAKESGKTLGPDLAAQLVTEVGPDLASLDQELFKLVAYVGSRSQITLDDARAICSSYHTLTGWQLAESLVWEERGAVRFPLIDTSFLLSLIGQIRYHLQLGIQICEGFKTGQADKFLHAARKFGPTYFKQGLQALFEMELAAKSSGIAPDLLLEIFTAKLLLRKDALSASKSSKR